MVFSQSAKPAGIEPLSKALVSWCTNNCVFLTPTAPPNSPFDRCRFIGGAVGRCDLGVGYKGAQGAGARMCGGYVLVVLVFMLYSSSIGGHYLVMAWYCVTCLDT